MAKATKKQTAKTTTSKKPAAKRAPKKTTMSKLKDAALSSEMLAAGLAAAGTAVASSPKARRAIYEAGVDAADEIGDAANRVMNNTAKFAALIGEAVAEAVERALASDVFTRDGGRETRLRTSSTGANKRVTSDRSAPKRPARKSNTRQGNRTPG